MNRKILTAIIATGLAIGTTTLTSCSKEETKPTTPATSNPVTRDMAIGLYSGLMTNKINGTINSDTGLFNIKKGPGNSVIIDDGRSFVTTADIIISTGSFAGNIPVQFYKVNSVDMKVEGKGDANKHFSFVAAENKFSYEFEIIDGPATGSTFSAVGIKK